MEREGEKRKEKGQEASRDTPVREEYYIQEHPRRQRRKGGKEGGGKGGAKFLAGSNEPQKSFGRSDHVEALSQLGPVTAAVT